jgi:hypothetical protein
MHFPYTSAKNATLFHITVSVPNDIEKILQIL